MAKGLTGFARGSLRSKRSKRSKRFQSSYCAKV